MRGLCDHVGDGFPSQMTVRPGFRIQRPVFCTTRPDDNTDNSRYQKSESLPYSFTIGLAPPVQVRTEKFGLKGKYSTNILTFLPRVERRKRFSRSQAKRRVQAGLWLLVTRLILVSLRSARLI